MPCPNIFSNSIKSQQSPLVPKKPQATGLVCAVISIRRGLWKLVHKMFNEKLSHCRKRVIQPTPYLYTMQNPKAFTNTLAVTILYLETLANTIGFCPKTKKLSAVNQNRERKTRERRQLIRNEHLVTQKDPSTLG